MKRRKLEVIRIKEFTKPLVFTSKLFIVANLFTIVKFNPNKNNGKNPLIKDVKTIKMLY